MDVDRSSGDRYHNRRSLCLCGGGGRRQFRWWKPYPNSRKTANQKWIYDNLLTDGSRIYFNEGTPSSLKVAQVAVIGGTTAIIPVRLDAPIVVDLSQEGASLLTVVGRTSPVSSLADNTVTHRRITAPGRYPSLDASFAADGRILFSREKVLTLPIRMAQTLASC